MIRLATRFAVLLLTLCGFLAWGCSRATPPPSTTGVPGAVTAEATVEALLRKVYPEATEIRGSTGGGGGGGGSDGFLGDGYRFSYSYSYRGSFKAPIPNPTAPGEALDSALFELIEQHGVEVHGIGGTTGTDELGFRLRYSNDDSAGQVLGLVLPRTTGADGGDSEYYVLINCFESTTH